ncbi:hypothetical protein EA749_12175 [Acinetobacter radioresistens]|jgi:hypothetical protein|uniref:hypothetical protein n=1 Tax=Acinetobacter TaxID=469 RepID=UPI00047DC5F8|nr:MULTISPECIES: hypothetical protein [Acinetobacter]MCU4517656.1 hypothetical protein [Acinetobacter radioresistens]MDA4862945.1 hypothetical protein [Acinetobacter baumannii]PKD86410.1 hypothetical protein CW313_00490 [Acinetobacter radioresistens]RSO65689.1 hypothetical protein EA749_12175 [Acinetobacter radioresistens]
MNQDLVLVYILKKSEVESVHFFGYLDNLNDQYVCCLTKKNVGQLILELQNSYGESFAAASVMTEKDFFQKENNYLEPIEISLTEYDEKFNILPPARTYGGFNFEMFMLPEQLGGGLFSHFLVTFEPYTKKRLKAYRVTAYRNDPFHKIFNSCPI